MSRPRQTTIGEERMTETDSEPTFLEWLIQTIAAIDAMEEQEQSE